MYLKEGGTNGDHKNYLKKTLSVLEMPCVNLLGTFMQANSHNNCRAFYPVHPPPSWTKIRK